MRFKVRSKVLRLCKFSLFFLPIFSFVVIKPVWEARLIAVTGCTVIFNLFLFVKGLDPNANFLIPRLKEKGSEWDKRNIPKIIRFIIIVFAVFVTIAVTIPLTGDCMAVAKKGRAHLTEVKGEVNANGLIFGTFFFLQNLSINRGEGSLSCTAIFFPYVIHIRKSYTFLIAPNTGVVLDIREESPGN